jgi:hypothetical protein
MPGSRQPSRCRGHLPNVLLAAALAGAAGCTAGSTTAAPASPVATSAPVAQTGLPAVIERLSPSVVTVRVGERLPAGPRPGSVGRMMTAWL